MYAFLRVDFSCFTIVFQKFISHAVSLSYCILRLFWAYTKEFTVHRLILFRQIFTLKRILNLIYSLTIDIILIKGAEFCCHRTINYFNDFLVALVFLHVYQEKLLPEADNLCIYETPFP